MNILALVFVLGPIFALSYLGSRTERDAADFFGWCAPRVFIIGAAGLIGIYAFAKAQVFTADTTISLSGGIIYGVFAVGVWIGERYRRRLKAEVEQFYNKSN